MKAQESEVKPHFLVLHWPWKRRAVSNRTPVPDSWFNLISDYTKAQKNPLNRFEGFIFQP